MANNIPREIIEKIFSNLPAKSVGKFRCLSKFWSIHLSSTEFTNLHLRNRRKTHNQGNNNIIVIAQDRSLHIITPTLNNEEVAKQIRLPNTEWAHVPTLKIEELSKRFQLPNAEWASVHGSCNGFVLLRNTYGNLFLVNPITLHQLNILNLPCYEFGEILSFGSRRTNYVEMFGLGYDLSRDDYKVVKFTCSYHNNGLISDFHQLYIYPYFYHLLNEKMESVHVYSVRTGAWKKVVVNNKYYPRVGLPPFNGYDFERCMAFMNGALHWLVENAGHTLIVVAFDLESEVFREIPVSTELESPFFQWRGCLCVVGGCLCIVAEVSVSGTTTDVWMMKEYGVVDSWTRYRISIKENQVQIDPSFCSVNGDELLNLCGASWIMYNMKQQTAKELVVGGASVRGASVFVDSLVSVDQLGVSSQWKKMTHLLG